MNHWRYVYRWIFWNLLSRTFVKTIIRVSYNYKLAPGSDKFPKPPFLAVANHGTFFDPWMVGSYSPYPFTFMVNDDGFRGNGLSKWYLDSIGCIPKKKGSSDFKAMKATINNLNNKHPVCIFPEGQTTWNGETQLIYRGIEKIIAKVKCPLVMTRIQGNFLTKPWWADTHRKGRVVLNTTVISSEEICKLSTDQIFDTIKNFIYQNDIKDPDNRKIPFKGKKLAQGLERFIWICMHCGKEDTLITSNNSISCTCCGKSWYIDAHCRLKPHEPNIFCFDDLKDWADMHRVQVQKRIADNPEILTSSTDVMLQLINKNKIFENSETGSLSLTQQTLSFNAQSGKKSWQIADIADIVIQKKDLFEFKHQNDYYRFLFNKKSPMKWVNYIRYLKGYSKCEEQGYL